MAPSRGLLRFTPLLRPFAHFPPRCSTTQRRTFAALTEALADTSNPVQSYVSCSNDPYLNLAIEDHILRKSSPDSAILFLYTNRPCVVIGRNQNPWYEVNLPILNAAAPSKSLELKDSEPPGIGDVQLVRRRSGGGTVFHDLGNLNWSITSPRADFTRDKHAEMVVRALRSLGVERARVNERHDIVLDQGHTAQEVDPEDTHRTPYTVENGEGPRPLKVSGSAYKLTRGRALHHATTLLSSPNLHIIPEYLHSPAKPFMEAKGVDSVSSPVGNIGLDGEAFKVRLQEQFAVLYTGGKELPVQKVGEEHLTIPEVRKGYDELRTNDWILSQTPQFTLRVPANNPNGPNDTYIEMNVRHGLIESFEFASKNCSLESVEHFRTVLLKVPLKDVGNWATFLASHATEHTTTASEIAKYLEEYLPIPDEPRS